MSRGIHPLVKVFSSGKEVSHNVGMSRDMFKVVIEVL